MINVSCFSLKQGEATKPTPNTERKSARGVRRSINQLRGASAFGSKIQTYADSGQEARGGVQQELLHTYLHLVFVSLAKPRKCYHGTDYHGRTYTSPPGSPCD